ncbi:MAG: phosphate signaling complex PhoU family protein, partial [Acidimicrobiales bacterium]
MTTELRTLFHQRLDQIDASMVRLFAIVTEGIAAATDAVLNGDQQASVSIVHQDEMVDALWAEVEDTAQSLLVLQSPVSRDLRFLLSVLRIAPELERSADLAAHIAERGSATIAAGLTPKVRGLVDRMGGHAVAMWRRLCEGYVERDAMVASVLDDVDDEMDRLHAELVRELGTGDLPPAVLMEMTLVARFYERLGDHAVNIARRIGYLAGVD